MFLCEIQHFIILYKLNKDKKYDNKFKKVK
jgi:hypothetical protein